MKSTITHNNWDSNSTGILFLATAGFPVKFHKEVAPVPGLASTFFNSGEALTYPQINFEEN